MADDVARYLAGRFSVLYDTPQEACFHRGAAVIERPQVGDRGYFTPWPFPAVILGPRASPWVQRHELFHAWLHDAAEHDICYELPAWDVDGDEEAAADRFAAYLTGEDE